MSELSIVIPIYNESDSLKAFLPQLVDFAQAHNWSLILVDDGSKDDSLTQLKNFENQNTIKVISHQINRGYGAAIKTGIKAVESPWLVTIDGDGQHNLEDIIKVFEVAKTDDFDLVIGNRNHEGKEDGFRKAGKGIIKSFAKLLMPMPIEDLNSGFKLYKTALAKKYAPLTPDSMAYSDVISLVFVSQGHKIAETPITVNPRKLGKSTININTAFDTLLQILNIAILFNPLKVFVPIALLCIFVGFAWGLPIVISGRGVSVGAMLAIVVGVIVFSIGLIAHQLSALRLQLVNSDYHEK